MSVKGILDKKNIVIPDKLRTIPNTGGVATVAARLLGYVTIATPLRKAAPALSGPASRRIEIIMFSGDKQPVVDTVVRQPVVVASA